MAIPSIRSASLALIGAALLPWAPIAAQAASTFPTSRSASWCRFSPGGGDGPDRPGNGRGHGPGPRPGRGDRQPSRRRHHHRHGQCGEKRARWLRAGHGDLRSCGESEPPAQAAVCHRQRAFAPVMLVGRSPNVLVVRKDSPCRTVQDVIAAAKAEPGRSRSPRRAEDVAHLAGELFKRLATSTSITSPKGRRPGHHRPARWAGGPDVRPGVRRRQPAGRASCVPSA